MAAEQIHHAVGPGLQEFFAGVNLLVVIAIVVVAGRKGIAASLKDRSTNIQKRLVDAKAELEKMKLEAEAVKRDIANIEVEKRKIIDGVSQEGKKLSDSLVREAKSTAERILADARLAAESELRSATEKLKFRLVSEAIGQSADMIKEGGADSKDIQARIHERLFQKFLDEVPAQIESSGGESNGFA